MGKKVPSAVILIILLALIVPGNLLSVSLFFGVDFIFGNIFVFLTAFLFGPLWAAAAGLISGLSCWFIWNHIWAFPVFTMEALVVSVLYSRWGKGRPIRSVFLFWILCGFPLSALNYRLTLGLDWNILAMVVSKQFLNSLFSASVSGLILAVPGVISLVSRSLDRPRRLVSLYELLSSMMIVLLMVTVLTLLVIDNREYTESALRESRQRILNTSDSLGTYLEDWKTRNRYTLLKLASQAGFHDMKETNREQQELADNTLEILSEYHYIYIADRQGFSIAFSPEVNAAGESGIGLDFSGHDYFSDLKKSVGPVFSDVFYDRKEVIEPIITIGSPVRVDGAFAGYAMGALKLDPIADMLVRIRGNRYQEITLIDSEGRVIAATGSARPFDPFISPDEGERLDLGEGVLQWFPEENGWVMQRFMNSYLYRKETVQDLNWTVYIRESLGPLYRSLIRISIRNILLASLYILILIPVLKLFSRQISLVLSRLIDISSRQLSGGTGEVESGEWPGSHIAEYDNLIRRMKEIQEQQSRASRLMKQQNEKLSGMNSALVRSEENLRITLSSIGDGVIVTDSAGRIVNMNPVACRLTGWTLSSAGSRHLDMILKLKEEQTGVSLEHPLGTVLESGDILRSSRRYILTDRLDHESNVTLSAAPIRISQEADIRGAVLVLRDVSEERRLEEQLRHSQKMEVVGQLAGGVAHDFNNLMAGILGLSEMVLAELDSESSGRESVRGIMKLVARASDLTGKLLAFSRKGKMVSRIVDLHAVLEDTVEILAHTIDKSISIRTEMGANRTEIMGDPTQIQNILMNLALNARDAMPEGGELVFTTSVAKGLKTLETPTGTNILTGNHLMVSVRDTGSGIDKDLLFRVFEPFFTTKGAGHSSGMGLSAVFGAVSEHNGAITVQSEKGEGTEFLIYFPLAQAEREEVPDRTPVPVSEHETILIVDDEEIIRNSLRAILAELGYQVHVAGNGEEALNLYREHAGEIALVILDAVMSGMSGMEVLTELKGINPLVKVMIASGFSSESSDDSFREAGAVDYIPKPFTLEELNMRIRRILTD